MQYIIGSTRRKLKAQPSLLGEIEAKLNRIKELILGNLRSRGLPRNAEELYAFEKSLQLTSCELINAVTAVDIR